MAEDDRGPRRRPARGGINRSQARRGLRYGTAMAALAFGISLGMSFPTQALSSRLGIAPAVAAILAVVAVGVVFDIVGVAAAAASEAPLHARAAKKRPGARQALWLVRHADKVNNFCTDVIGDICGTLSGAAASTLVLRLVTMYPHAGDLVPQVVVVSGVAALTIGGKAACKGLAIRRSGEIITWAGELLARLHLLRPGNNNRPRSVRGGTRRGQPSRRKRPSRPHPPARPTGSNRPGPGSGSPSVTDDGPATRPRRTR
ncbi:MAG: hypothetical protein QME70_00330 [Bacillota bacterium]|nr:hypothetical protein [Bacillota bacterium]